MDGLSELRTTSWTLTQVGFEGCGTFCSVGSMIISLLLYDLTCETTGGLRFVHEHDFAVDARVVDPGVAMVLNWSLLTWIFCGPSPLPFGGSTVLVHHVTDRGPVPGGN